MGNIIIKNDICYHCLNFFLIVQKFNFVFSSIFNVEKTKKRKKNRMSERPKVDFKHIMYDACFSPPLFFCMRLPVGVRVSLAACRGHHVAYILTARGLVVFYRF